LVSRTVRRPVAAAGVASGDTIECDGRGLPEDTAVLSELELAEALMPELRQVHVGALKEAIGPTYIALEDTRTQVDARTRLVDGIQEKIAAGDFAVKRFQTINFTTKMAHDLDVLRELALGGSTNRIQRRRRGISDNGTPRSTAHVGPDADQERRVRDLKA
jgi:hypothetical protein